MSAVPAISPARLAANRANAQLSTGPTTPEGKAKSSLNAVKTGLTGRAVLLPNEDADAYETHLLQYLEEFQPVGARETELVQSLADTQWRLNRIPSLEAGFYALGRLRHAELFPDPHDRHLLDAHILMQDAKHFKNLHLQESRLRRQYRQDAQELKELQRQRKKEQEEKEAASKPQTLIASVGFEFATPEPHSEPRGDCKGKVSSSSNRHTEL